MLISVIRKNIPAIIGGVIAIVFLLYPAARDYACGSLGIF